MKCIAITANFLLTASIVVIFNKVFGCELSWIRHADRCYRIVETKLDKSASATKCMRRGAHLASIDDVSTYDFLAEHVSLFPQSKFWVGLVKSWTNRTRFRWYDAGDLQNETWVKVPEIVSPYDSKYKYYCFAFNGTLVTEEDCHDLHGSICERKDVSNKNPRACTGSSNVHHSFIGQVTGNCIFTDLEQIKKYRAEGRCQKYNGHFVDFDEILAEGLTAFYEDKVLSNDGSRYWTNLEWNGTNLIRKNGEVLPQDYPVLIVENWPISGPCITVQFDFTDILIPKFHHADCNTKAYALCSKGIEKEDAVRPNYDRCPNHRKYKWQADKFSDFCFMETSSDWIDNWWDWDDAEKYCQSLGGHLASFHSKEEEDIDISDRKRVRNLWIGLSLDVENETYSWSDGSPLDYENWAPGQPNHKNKTLRCVLKNTEDELWRSALCGVIANYICKAPKGYLNFDDFRPAYVAPCSQFIYYRPLWRLDGPCYFVYEGALRWNEAREYCEGRRAHLVSIHSAEEMGFLLRLIRQKYGEYRMGRFWIGLNAHDNDGNLLWTDGTAVDFTYFPDNGISLDLLSFWQFDTFDSPSPKKCGIMKNGIYGEWKYEDCNRSYSFICKTVYGRTSPTIAPTTIAPTTIAPTTLDPTKIGDLGNSQSGWIPHRTIVIKNPESTETVVLELFVSKNQPKSTEAIAFEDPKSTETIVFEDPKSTETSVFEDPKSAETSVFEEPKSAEQLGFPTAGIFAVIFSILMIAALIVVAVFFRKRISELLQLRRKDTHSRINISNAKYDACSSSMTFNKENKN